ncbi:MAG: A/G-specific adenine glycosylase [Planctomycetota bacterium]|nr:A/G-specific adenine glycosylase [Planctomycetota bacterium]
MTDNSSTSNPSTSNPSTSNLSTPKQRKWLTSIRSALLEWFATSQRELPWRQTTDPYAIWISEIMLQQTQVATVLPYYFRFLGRFPTVQELASADEVELMRYWEGLGYYRRARQMHAASKQIIEAHNGVFPTYFEEVLALPGIGRYTAGAICSFAYDASTPIVEANTQRLYARLLQWDKPLTERQSQDRLWEFAAAILPETSGSRQVNYAAMELGSLVCRPQPDCPRCPVVGLCPTARNGLQTSIPAPKVKTVYSDRFEVALLIRDHDCENEDRNKHSDAPKYIIRQCGPNEWWTGLWDFPRIEISAEDFEELDRPLLVSSIREKSSQNNKNSTRKDQLAPAFQKINESLLNRFGIAIQIQGGALRTIKHSVTRYRIQLRVCNARLMGPFTSDLPGFRWAALEEIHALPLSASARKVFQGLQ